MPLHLATLVLRVHPANEQVRHDQSRRKQKNHNNCEHGESTLDNHLDARTRSVVAAVRSAGENREHREGN